METIKGKCPSCKKIENLTRSPWRTFKVMEGKRNKKIVCEKCGMKIFIKKDSDPNSLFHKESGKLWSKL